MSGRPARGLERRALGYALSAAGAVCLALSVAGAGAPISMLGLAPRAFATAVAPWRWLSLLAGWVLLPIGAMVLVIAPSGPERHERALARNALAFLAMVAVLAVANHAVMAAGRYHETAYYFPISVFEGPRLHATGVPFIIAFLVVLWLALKTAPRLNAFQVWWIALGLIVLGNLGQGGVREAFRSPLAGSGVHYYHEALRMGDWRVWLRAFNGVQESLGTHARTHPPFVVLIHSLLMRVTGRSILPIAGAFTLLSSLTVPLVRSTMREIGLPRERATECALLLAVVPAFNVYSAVSLDGVVATLAAAVLLGLVVILRRGLSVAGVTLFVIGLVLANALTFGGLLLAAVAGLIALAEVLGGGRRRDTASRGASPRSHGVAVALAVAVGVGLVLIRSFRTQLGYDHVRAFLTAVRLERALGATPVRATADYLWTRAEDVLEIGLFASVGVLAVLFRPRLLGPRALDMRDRVSRVPLAMGTVLAASLLVGTYRTGETARACLFVYPFLMLALRGLDGRMLRALALSAGVQTAAMQLFGAYFW